MTSLLAAVLVAGTLVAGQQAVAAPVEAAAPTLDTPGSAFVPRSPLRVLDTRTAGGPVGADGTVTVNLAGRVPATATAVVLNVTGVAPTASTYVTAYPGGTTRPDVSNLNLSAGEIRANQVTVALGAGQTVALYNNSGRTHLVADLAGHYGTAAGSLFTALSPKRALDTRQESGPLGPDGIQVLDLRDSVPASASAVTFNLTATGTTAPTYVTAWPTGTTRPTASNLNVVAGETRPNQVTVAIGADRHVSLYNNSGSVHLLADVTGFYTPDYGAEFVPITPTRVLDTREGAAGPVGEERTILLDVSDDLPVTTTGVAVNLTGLGATVSTYVTAWGQSAGQPYWSSTLNLVPRTVVPNAATVAFDRHRGIELYNHRGSTHLISDLSGVFVVPSADCAPGCVRSWGDNSARQLGTGQTVPASPDPTPVAGLSGVRQVASGGWGGGTGYALLEDGTVRAWGDNGAGQLGNGWTWTGPTPNTAFGSAVPVPVLGLTDVTMVAAGGWHAFALRSDGTVWAWGTGFLGAGTYDTWLVPTRVPNLTDVVGIASGGQTTYVVKADGTVWAWGENGFGQVGTGAPDEEMFVYTPVRITALSDVVSVGAGNGTGYAVKADGTVWALGDNRDGQLGNGQGCDPDPAARCESRVPVPVSGLTGATTVVGNRAGAYALRADGTVAAWGSSTRGRLGDGVPCEDPVRCVARTPVPVAGMTDVTDVATFEYGGYALRADGTVWAWGDNVRMSLGNELVDGYTATPVSVTGLAGVTGVDGGYFAGYAVSS